MFWPDGSKPTETIPFRGLNKGGEQRNWRDVPYPEKLGLAQTIASQHRHADGAAVMAEEIGLGRLRQATREELESLLKAAQANL